MQNNGPCEVGTHCPRRRRCPIGSHKERVGNNLVCTENNEGYVGKRNRRSCRKNQVCLARRRCKNGTRRKRNAAGQMVCRRVRGVPTPTPQRGDDQEASLGFRMYNHGPPSSVVTENNSAEQEILNELAENESTPSLFDAGPGVADVPVQQFAPNGLPEATSLQEAASEYNREALRQEALRQEALRQEALRQEALQETPSSSWSTSRQGSNINVFPDVFASRNTPSANARSTRGQNININNPPPLDANDYVDGYQPIFEADELAQDAAINQPVGDDNPQYDEAIENVAQNDNPVVNNSPIDAAPAAAPAAAPVVPAVASPVNPPPNAGRHPIGKVPRNKVNRQPIVPINNPMMTRGRQRESAIEKNPRNKVNRQPIVPINNPMMTRGRKRESAIANRLPSRSAKNKQKGGKGTKKEQKGRNQKTQRNKKP